MPELPEVETVRRGLALKMSGRRILQAELRRPDLRRPFPPALAARLDGAHIGALGRRGKYILIELDSDGLLLMHLGMSGRVTASSAALPDAPHDHVVLRLDDGTVIRFNDPRRFGLLDYVKRGEAAQHPLLAGLGPEPLEAEFNGPYLLAKLAVHRGLDRLVRPDSALRKLPAAAAAPPADQHEAGPVDQDDADVRTETVLVDEVHGSKSILSHPRDGLQKPSAGL